MLILLLLLVLLALVVGGFFVFALKVALIVAVVLMLMGLLGGYSLRGRARRSDRAHAGAASGGLRMSHRRAAATRVPAG